MDKKTIKIIYKLKTNKHSQRKIKQILYKKYNINIKQKDINDLANKIVVENGKFNSLDKKRILNLYSKIINTEKLVDYLNNKYSYDLTVNRIKEFAHNNSIKKSKQNMYKQSFVSRNDEFEILKLYKKGYSSKDIAEIYGYKTQKSVLDKVKKFDCEIRNWNEEQSKNKSYIDFSMKIIDNKFKAYFLGLILTDGYMNEKRNYIGIDLIDKDVIEFISKEINVKYTVIENEKINSQYNVKDKYRIIIYGKELVNDFKRLGVTENKTFTVKGPNLNKEELKYIPYILRGIIDGDGWIRNDGKEFFIVSASKDLIYWCKENLELLEFNRINVKFIDNKWNGIYQIRSARKENIEMLKKKIYTYKFGMVRKYDLLL